eukprot:6203727-Pleurochrysis_carterae.AAC.4
MRWVCIVMLFGTLDKRRTASESGSQSAQRNGSPGTDSGHLKTYRKSLNQQCKHVLVSPQYAGTSAFFLSVHLQKSFTGQTLVTLAEHLNA